MKGLLLYEFLSMRKTIIFSVCIVLPLVFVFFVIVTLGIEHGNLRELGIANLSDAFVWMFDIFVTFYAGFCGYIAISSKFTTDIKGWNKYSFSLPVSNVSRIGARYAITAIVTIAVFSVTLGMSATLRRIANQSTDEILHIILFVFCTAAAASHIGIALLYIVKSKLIVAVIGLAVSVFFVLANASAETVSTVYEDGTRTTVFMSELERLIYGTLWFMPLVLAVVIALSFLASLMAAKGRERLC